MTIKRFFPFFLICFFLILYLVNCGLGRNTQSSTTITQSYIGLATNTISATSNEFHTRTPTPTPTLKPAVKTARAESVATFTSIASTNEVKGVKCPQGYIASPNEFTLEAKPIYNSHWLVFTCSPVPENPGEKWTPGAVDYSKRYDQVINKDTNQTWTISYKGFSWSYRPYAYLHPFRLTEDGNYLFFVPIFIPGGSGRYAPDFFYDDIVLYRLDLQTGTFEEVLPYTETDGYAFSLSPNDEYLAYRNPNENDIIHVRNLITDNDMQIDLDEDYELTGAFIWAVDSKQVFFASARPGWEEGKAGISIFSLDINNMALHTILDNDKRLIIPFNCFDDRKSYSWEDENLLCVWSLDYLSEAYFSNLLLNVNTGDIVIAATPKPGLANTSTPTP